MVGISFEEFLKIMTDQKRPCDEDTTEDFYEVFLAYDMDQKGYISRDDIKESALDLNENLTDQELDDIMIKFDPTGEGKINFQNFHKLMQEAVRKTSTRR